MSLSLEDAKQIVRVIVEKQGNDRSFVAGVVMLAPLFCKSQDPKIIRRATGFHATSVERAVTNLLRYGVWGRAENGQPLFVATWPEMFVSWDTMTEKRQGEIEIEFILDCFVADGTCIRTARDGEFFYQMRNVKV